MSKPFTGVESRCFWSLFFGLGVYLINAKMGKPFLELKILTFDPDDMCTNEALKFERLIRYYGGRKCLGVTRLSVLEKLEPYTDR